MCGGAEDRAANSQPLSFSLPDNKMKNYNADSKETSESQRAREDTNSKQTLRTGTQPWNTSTAMQMGEMVCA